MWSSLALWLNSSTHPSVHKTVLVYYDYVNWGRTDKIAKLPLFYLHLVNEINKGDENFVQCYFLCLLLNIVFHFVVLLTDKS